MINKQPKVSVVIPTYKDNVRLRKCIASLVNQICSTSVFEVIIVNNDYEELIFDEPLPANFVVTQELNPGSYAARNKGVNVARGEIVAFTDSDCIPDVNWIQEILKFHEYNNDCLMSGNVLMFSERGAVSNLNFVESYDYLFGINQDIDALKGTGATANLSVPKNILESLNGFDTTLFSGGDSDLCKRARLIGFNLIYNSKAIVKHPLRSSVKEIKVKSKRMISSKIKREGFVALLRLVTPPIVRSKIILSRKEVSARVKLKAFLMIFYIKSIQLLHAFSVTFLNAGHERR